MKFAVHCLILKTEIQFQDLDLVVYCGILRSPVELQVPTASVELGHPMMVQHWVPWSKLNSMLAT